MSTMEPTALAQVEHTQQPGLYRVVGADGSVYVVDSRVRIRREDTDAWLTLRASASIETGPPHDHSDEVDMLRTGCTHVYICATDGQDVVIRQAACSEIERIA